jgi:hypothetical protein
MVIGKGDSKELGSLLCVGIFKLLTNLNSNLFMIVLRLMLALLEEQCYLRIVFKLDLYLLE